MLRPFLARFDGFSKPFWMIACGTLVSSAGASLVWPFQLIYISRILGLKLAMVGTLISVSSGVGLTALFLAGTLADRLGRKPAMIAAQGMQTVAYLLMVRAHTYLGFLVPMTLLAASQPIYSVGSDSMMADLVPPERRASGYSIMRILNNVGVALGPAVGGFIVSRSYALAFKGAALVILAYGLFLVLYVRETLPRAVRVRAAVASRRKTGGYPMVFRDRGFMLFTALVTVGMTAPLMLWTLLAVYTKQTFGFPEHLYSWLPITNALMCVFVQFLVTRYTRDRQPLAMITLGMAVYAVGVGSVALMSGFWGFWTSMVILTFGELIVSPTGTTYVANRSAPEVRGRYMSIYWMTWGLARAAAPVVGGFLNDQISPHAIWYGGLLIGLTSSLGLYFFRASKAQRIVPELARTS